MISTPDALQSSRGLLCRMRKMNFTEGRLTGKSRSWRVLKSAPRRPPPTETRKMNGSWLNHSELLSSATPLKERTPFRHLCGSNRSHAIARLASPTKFKHCCRSFESFDVDVSMKPAKMVK